MKDGLSSVCVLIIILLMLVCFCSVAFACEIDLNALAMVESTNNPNAVSFLGAKYGRGKFQISEILLKSYNERFKTRYSPQELFKPDVNRAVCLWALNEEIPRLLRHYGKEVTLEAVLQSYNLGAYAYAIGKRNADYVRKYRAWLPHV
jgi:soluble lytic murein transglycosylase-like protein